MDEGEKRSEEEGGRVLDIGLTVDSPSLGSVIFSSFNGGAKYSPFNGGRGCYEIAVNLRGEANVAEYLVRPGAFCGRGEGKHKSFADGGEG